MLSDPLIAFSEIKVSTKGVAWVDPSGGWWLLLSPNEQLADTALNAA